MNRWPARLDLLQSATGLVLVVFMWGHMFFVSSILVSDQLMWTVTRMFEGYYLFGRAYPGIVSAVAALVAIVFAAHALLALRKVPSSYRQYSRFADHSRALRHADTTLWWVQVVTGLVLVFVGTAHLVQMAMHPEGIGPYASPERVWTMWPMYLVMLFAVELHGGIGLYRLAVKWGWFEGRDANVTRRRLTIAMWSIIGFFLAGAGNAGRRDARWSRAPGCVG